MDNIYQIIEECDLGIHDISRTELNPRHLPRFNMPLEPGIFFGAIRYGSRRQKTKKCLILDVARFRYQEFISDIAGQDIQSHNNEPEDIIRRNRNWLNSLSIKTRLPGTTAITDRYRRFLTLKPQILQSLNLNDDDVEYADITQIIEEWIIQNPV